jgi:hypothetical protein
MADEVHLSERELGELARLADGTLPERRRAEVQARVDASPQLRALVEEQRRALALVRGAGGEAPVGLRARLADARRAAAPRMRRWRVGLAAGAAVAATATALALVLTLPGNLPGGPTVVQAAQLANRPPQAPAPAQDPANGSLLRAAVQGVPFPNWEYSFRWAAAGQRTDRLHGRRVTTVFYRRGPLRVAYSIIGGDYVGPPVATTPVIVGDTVFRYFRAGGRTIVTWKREDHTCVLTARDVPVDVMVALASWSGSGNVPF